MANKKLGILLGVFLASSSFFLTPANAYAVVQTLNGQTGNTQSFANDTNVTISSSSNIHSLNWQGLLGISRGGTNASSFTNGSIFFYNGSAFSQDNSNLFWDNTNNRLGIGTNSPTNTLSVNGNLDVSGTINSTNLIPYIGATQDLDLGSRSIIMGLDSSIFTLDAITNNTDAISMNFGTGSGLGSGQGGNTTFTLGNGGDVGNGGTFSFNAGDGGSTSGNGGYYDIRAGDAQGGNSNGGSFNFYAGAGSGTGSDGTFTFDSGGGAVIFDLSNLAGAGGKFFTFPNAEGTFGLLQTDQTWTGLNKFEGSNSTVYVGSTATPGCIVLGDTGGSSVTYVTANAGVLSASSTKPSNCQ